MLDYYTLTANENEIEILAELRSYLLPNMDKTLTAQFASLIDNKPLINKLDRFLARDDNAFVVDLIAELSSILGVANGHMIASSIILSDKLFLEPIFDNIRLATYPTNFANTILDLDEKHNRVTGSGTVRTIGIQAHTMLALVRGTQSGKIGVVAVPMKDIEIDLATPKAIICNFNVDAKPQYFRNLNRSGVEKAIKEVYVTNFSLALGSLREARLATESHCKNHILFGKPLLQHQSTQSRLAQGVVHEELLRAITIRQHSEFTALQKYQVVMIHKIRGIIQQSFTDMAHLHGAESVLERTSIPFMELKSTILGLIDESITGIFKPIKNYT
ncbi:hypothetical protein OAP63_00710 [Vibrio sp.]|nr:hypothetical protein [Vibrio sp.]